MMIEKRRSWKAMAMLTALFLLVFPVSAQPSLPAEAEVSSHRDDAKADAEEASAQPLQKAGERPLELNQVKDVSLMSGFLQGLPKVDVIATGYTAGVESTGKTPDHPQYGITYSGVKVVRDVYSTIAADLSVFPLGTILYIPGYGFGVVADTGSAIQGNRIDLYFPTVEQVYREWGKRQVEAVVIRMGDGELVEEVMLDLNRNAYPVEWQKVQPVEGRSVHFSVKTG